MLVTLLGCAVIALANGLLTNALYGAPKGVYLFVGKEYPSSGTAGQMERVARGYSAVNAVSGGWSSINPCEADGGFVCVGMDLDLTGVSVVDFEFDPSDFTLTIGGTEVRSGGPIADRIGWAIPVGPKRLGRGQTYQTGVGFAVPRDAPRTGAVFSWRDGDRTIASWRYATALWAE
ncbi:hypothetical protein TPB0596_09080 [Tsukamurella pulmonis]|uniref:hypothetical protein n=1 Tax=Tsukamurella pulmonis TaxID=47312 RepID=UPI001EE0EBDB|nr:hypothetical protein [Tsukamurella pulmonis]BDD81145.1 hypothetical protein TPB0596_09080 [Tsukamurella pulmonis]